MRKKTGFTLKIRVFVTKALKEFDGQVPSENKVRRTANRIAKALRPVLSKLAKQRVVDRRQEATRR